MDEQPEGKKAHETSIISEDDSMLDFKSPVQISKTKLNLLSNSCMHKKQSTSAKLMDAEKNSKDSKFKELLAVGKNCHVSESSLESYFLKTKRCSYRKDLSPVTKVTLVCPICLKVFKNMDSHTLHMKVCAYKNNISRKKLFNAIELQKQQENERKTLGLIATPILQDKKKTVSRGTISHEESDLELALALSKSLQEATEFEIIKENYELPKTQDECLEAAKTVTEVKLRNFKFTNSKDPLLIKNRKRRNYEPTLLQTRSSEERNQILTERISEILMGNETITQKEKEGNEQNYVIEKKTVLKSHLLRQICNQEEKLWSGAKLFKNERYFYVSNLSDFIISPAIKEGGVVSEFTNICNIRNMSWSQYMTGNDKQDELLCTKCMHEKCENCVNGKFTSTVIKKWADTLNNSSASDLVIFVNNDKHIWAHKLVFYVQCSNILLDVTPNDTLSFTKIKEKLCWMDISYNHALAFLEFIYCGYIEKYRHIFEDLTSVSCLRNLARKYKVTALFTFLERKEIEIMQGSTEIHSNDNEELISEKTEDVILNTDNAKCINVKNDSQLINFEEFSDEDVGEYNRNTLKFVTTRSKSDICTDLISYKKMEHINNASAISNFNLSPDLFDDVNETVQKGKSQQINCINEILNGKTGKDNVDKILLDVTGQVRSETVKISSADNATLFKSDDKCMKKILNSPQFNTPKRKKSSQIKKPRSNLSLFIEQFQKENEKSDTNDDSETTMHAISPKLCRNPFNMKQYNISNQCSVSNTDDVAKNTVIDERNILSMFDFTVTSEADTNAYADDENRIRIRSQSINIADSSNFSTAKCDGTYKKNISYTQTSSATQCGNNIDNISLSSENSETDEEEMSMYSKYKRGHENNSIIKYRNFVQKDIKCNANSNVGFNECTKENNTDTNVTLLSSKNKMFDTSSMEEFINDKKNKSPKGDQRTILKSQVIDNSNKLKPSMSDGNVSLQEIPRNSLSLLRNSGTKHDSFICTASVSLNSDSESDILNVHDFCRSKRERHTFCEERIHENDHDFESNIYLANAHILHEDDNSDILSSSIDINELNKEIVSPVTSRKNDAPITTSSCAKLKKDERRLFQRQNVRKLETKSVSETSLQAIPSFFKNPTNTSCKCRHRKILEVDKSPEVIRDSVTPPPDFKGMLTPELQTKLSKYGLKVQKRKRATKLLSYIYNELHPTIRTVRANIESEIVTANSEDTGPPMKKINCRQNDIHYMHNEQSQSPLLQESYTGTRILENIIDKEEFNEPEFTSVTDGTQNIRNVFMRLLTINKELYNKILTYEPICINSLHSMLKAEGFKCKMNTLVEFLDEQCITFYLDDKSKQSKAKKVLRKVGNKSMVL